MAETTYSLHIVEEGQPIEKWIADLKEWEGPPHKATGKFEALLAAAFTDTQARTHIITGSLKASGKTSSDLKESVWEGEIEYGGPLWAAPAPGPPNDPVRYAIYEMARGGLHDFFAGLPGYENKMGEVIDELFPFG